MSPLGGALRHSFPVRPLQRHAYAAGLPPAGGVVATLSNPAGIHNQEWGGHVYLCTGLVSPWTQLWPQLRHYY